MAIDDMVSAGLGMADEEAPESETTSTSAPAPQGFERPRKSRLKIDHAKIAQRVVDFFNEDEQDRLADIEARVQRYAKFRMWTEGKDWPWEDSSDAAHAGHDDALAQGAGHAAQRGDVVTRPGIIAKALKKPDKDKEDRVNTLLDSSSSSRTRARTSSPR
jgi:hypothetical protein